MQAKQHITINRKARLYVMHSGTGFSCLGFDQCARLAQKLADELDEPAPTQRPGSLALYREYQRLLGVGYARNRRDGWRSSAELTPELVGLEGCRVAVEDEWGNTRRFWVGKSTGWCPVHLEVARRDSSGGPAVCIGKPRRVTVICHHK